MLFHRLLQKILRSVPFGVFLHFLLKCTPFDEGFDWLESTELAIDKRKFLLNRLYQQQPIPQDED